MLKLPELLGVRPSRGTVVIGTKPAVGGGARETGSDVFTGK